MRAALVDNSGNVVGVTILDPSWQTPGTVNSWAPPAGQTVVQSDIAGVGWTYANGVFTAPPSNPVPVLSANQQRLAAFIADSGRADLFNRLLTAQPSDIDTWLTNNVTTLAQARTVLGAVIKVMVCLLSPNT